MYFKYPLPCSSLLPTIILRSLLPSIRPQAGSSNEIAYAVLAHVALIIDRNPGVFDDEFKQVRAFVLQFVARILF